MWQKLKNITPDTWARTICLFVALANQILIMVGKEVLPFAENDIYQAVSIIATIVTGVVAWWHNNSFTENAIKADKYLDELKSEKTDDELKSEKTDDESQ